MQKNEAQNERLAILSEECGETVQIIGKTHRHGMDSFDPFDPFDPKKVTNRTKLEKKSVIYSRQLHCLDTTMT